MGIEGRTHKPLVVSSNLTLGTQDRLLMKRSYYLVVSFLYEDFANPILGTQDHRKMVFSLLNLTRS